MFLFGTNTSGQVGDCGGTIIYYAKIFENGKLIRSYVPARRIKDNVLGLYDEITKTLYTNKGQDDFVAGPAK